ncbi:MAG: VOC family protein [Firmicutes bacterium]|nr:VOC family protein [Bacillota bacterium]
MKFKFNTILVKELSESLKFYTDILNLKTVDKFSPNEGINIVFLKDDDGNKFELIENKMENKSFDRKSIVTLGFDVENLDKTMYFLKQNNIKIAKGPITIPNGRFIVIEDPNGVGIGLYENL